MSFRSTATFKCDGCKVVESEGIEVTADIMQARPPVGWLRIEMHKLSRVPSGDALDAMSIKHYCTHCTPMVESYLAGRTDNETAKDDAHAAH
jgi:hypothetical protein